MISLWCSLWIRQMETKHRAAVSYLPLLKPAAYRVICGYSVFLGKRYNRVLNGIHRTLKRRGFYRGIFVYVDIPDCIVAFNVMTWTQHCVRRWTDEIITINLTWPQEGEKQTNKQSKAKIQGKTTYATKVWRHRLIVWRHRTIILTSSDGMRQHGSRCLINTTRRELRFVELRNSIQLMLDSHQFDGKALFSWCSDDLHQMLALLDNGSLCWSDTLIAMFERQIAMDFGTIFSIEVRTT